MSMKRFRVSGHSMTPGLQPGQEVVASNTRDPEPGNLVVFEHPERPGMWLVKRLVDAAGWVLADNPEASVSDSRVFGALDPGLLMPVVDQLDEATFVEACEMLADEDPQLAALVATWGVPEFWRRDPGFRSLVLLILEQQVSLESGAAMYQRLADEMGDVTPDGILATGTDRLRALGVTRQKAGYLIGLAQLIVAGDLDLDGLIDLPEDDARRRLVSIKGIGAWTADAYLLSALRRPDIWPVGDRALQVGTGEILGMGSAPDPVELEIVAEPWRPVRAAAARLIWHAYLAARGRVEPPNPALVHEPRVDA